MTDHTGRVWRLGELRGRWVVIFFYPRDFSPVCTAQSCAFRDATPRLAGMGAVVIGVSGDAPASHARFVAAHALPYPLVSDADGSVGRAFGVKRRVLGLLPGRETIVVGPDGRVAMVYRAALKGAEHAERALRVIQPQSG